MSPAEHDPEHDTARELRMLLGPLRRELKRATPPPAAAASLTSAQVELLRAVEQHGPLTTTELAGHLSLARPTVSNLVKQLTQVSLLSRELSPIDARAILIGVTDEAHGILREAGRQRVAVLQDAIDSLSAADRQTLDEALPVLRRILESLQERGARHD